MNFTAQKLHDLFNRIPRRQSTDNVKDIYAIVEEYEDVLRIIEAEPDYEKQVALFFDELDNIRTTIKKSTDSKASKKQKDIFFDEASGALKDSMQELKTVYEN